MIASQTWTWDDFSGGEADGFKKGPQGSVRVTENVDCRRNDGGMALADEYSFFKNYEGNITAVSPVNSITSAFEPSFTTFDGAVGRLYSGSNAPLVIADSTSYGKKIIALSGKYWNGTNPGASIQELNTYAISSNSGNNFRIHRITPDYTTITYGVASGTLPNRSPSLGSVSSASVYQDLNRLIIGIGNGVFELTQSDILTLKLTFNPDIEVKGITKFQDSYRVYFSTSPLINGNSDSFIGYWDGQSNELSQIARYDNSRILSVIGGDAYDYVTFGKGVYTDEQISDDLYVVGGLTRNKLRVSHNITKGDTRGFGVGGTFKDGVLYIPGKNKNGNFCLYENGSFFRGQNESLCSSTTSYSLVGLNKPISHVSFNGDNRYVWIDGVDGNFGKMFSKTIVYSGWVVNNGFFITLPFFGIGPHTKKRLEKVRAGFNLGHSDSYISILARVNGDETKSNTDGFVLIGTFNDDSLYDGEILSSAINSVLPSEWNSIEFRIVMSQGVYNTCFRSLEIEYTDNLKN